MLELMNIPNKAKKLIVLYGCGGQGSYVGTWMWKEWLDCSSRGRGRGLMENHSNWWSVTDSSDGVHRLEVCLIFTSSLHQIRWLDENQMIYVQIEVFSLTFPFERDIFLEPLLSVCANKKFLVRQINLKSGAMNHLDWIIQSWSGNIWNFLVQ